MIHDNSKSCCEENPSKAANIYTDFFANKGKNLNDFIQIDPNKISPDCNIDI